MSSSLLDKRSDDNNPRPPVYRGAPRQTYEDDDAMSQVSGVSYGTYSTMNLNLNRANEEKKTRDWCPRQPSIREDDPLHSPTPSHVRSSIRDMSPHFSSRIESRPRSPPRPRSPSSPSRSSSPSRPNYRIDNERVDQDYTPHSRYSSFAEVNTPTSTYRPGAGSAASVGGGYHRPDHHNISSSASVNRSEDYYSGHDKPPEYIWSSKYHDNRSSASASVFTHDS